MLTPRVIVDSLIEPIDFYYFKTHARVDASDEDDQSEVFISAARRYFEKRAGYTVHEKTLEMVYDDWPSCARIELPWATPLIAISSVKYKDSAALETTWAAANYIADTDHIPGRLVRAYGIDWPVFTKYPSNPIRIRYTAGIPTASPVSYNAPEDVKELIALIAAHFFNNREAVAIDNVRGNVVTSGPIALTVDSLIAGYMQWKF